MSDPYEDFLKSSRLALVASQTAGVPHWGKNPDAWDTVFLMGVPIPGRCRVEGEIGFNYDHKKVPGTHGSKLTFEGYQAAELTIHVEIWTEAHLAAWDNFVFNIRPRDKPFAMDLSYPATANVRISSVKVAKIQLLKRDDSRDCYTTQIKCIENWDPPRSRLAKVDSSANSVDNKKNAITPQVDKAVPPSSQNQNFNPANTSFP